MIAHDRLIALPLCPPRWASEALGVWLHRICWIYEIDFADLLDQVRIRHRGTPRSGWTIGLSAANIGDLAHALHLKAEELSLLLPDTPDWLIRSTKSTPICLACWIADYESGRPIRLRAAWLHAWRVFCPTHHLPLESIFELTGSHYPTELTVARVVAERRDIVRGFRPVPGLGIAGLLSAEVKVLNRIRALEVAIARAVQGIRPNSSWGPISALEFLSVVDDICMVILNDFAKPGTIVNRGTLQTLPCRTIPLLTWKNLSLVRTHHVLRPRLLTLADIGDPAMRRTVLLHAAALLGNQLWRPLSNAYHSNLTTRWRRLHNRLRLLSAPAREWLSTRMQQWPTRYLTHFWPSKLVY